jgi:rifampicin phosphotransferase
MTATLRASRAVNLLSHAEALRARPEIVGGKAHALARLVALGVRVPRFFVLGSHAFGEQLERAGLAERVDAELERLTSAPVEGPDGRRAVEETARALGAIVDSMTLDPELEQALAFASATLGAPEALVAVRSSAVGEDGEHHSFAGQLDSVLGVRHASQIAEAVRRCWKSALGERALDYRRRTGMLAEACRVAVIVQRMVVGDVSGVLFTLDPVTGDASRMRVSAVRGLGESLVSGEADGDEYLIGRDGREVEVRIADAEERLLDRIDLAVLATEGAHIAAAEGGARDIEWTIARGELWILQARPITSAAVPGREHRIVWDNSNIQESYFGVTTPLTFSFASASYASVYEQTMRAMRVPEAVIGEHRPMLRNLLGLIRGRVYYNLNNWYRGLLLLPSFGRNKEDMERMMGVDEPVDFVADGRVGLVERLRRLPRFALTLGSLLRRFATLPRDTYRFLREFDAAIEAVDRKSIGRRSLGELMALLDQLRRRCIERWTTPIVNDFYVMMSAGRLRRAVSRVAPSETEPLMQALLGGADVAVSAGPAMLLLRMAALAREDASLAAALRSEQDSAALADARAASESFAALMDELMARYGDRCMGELKLESRPMRDDPAFVLRMLRNYMDAPVAEAATLARGASEAREAARQQVESRLGTVARMRFRRALAAARRGVRAREEMRLARTRLFGVHREIYRAIGARLHESGSLESPDDVLYLTTTEIAAYWEGTAASADLSALVRARRTEFARYEGESVPNRIITTGAPHESVVPPAAVAASAAKPADARILKGLGCSRGVVEGRVRIITSPSDDLAIAGHILVAPRTDPGWSPLFPSAAGIIVERGSLLSHSAVLARELGLPAVVGIPGVVTTLREGERVRIDGEAGTVERLEQ